MCVFCCHLSTGILDKGVLFHMSMNSPRLYSILGCISINICFPAKGKPISEKTEVDVTCEPKQRDMELMPTEVSSSLLQEALPLQSLHA